MRVVARTGVVLDPFGSTIGPAKMAYYMVVSAENGSFWTTGLADWLAGSEGGGLLSWKLTNKKTTQLLNNLV